MSAYINNLPNVLIYNFCWIALAAVVVQLVITALRIKSAYCQQIAWFLVLVPAGCLINIRYSLTLPTPWPTENNSLSMTQSVTNVSSANTKFAERLTGTLTHDLQPSLNSMVHEQPCEVCPPSGKTASINLPSMNLPSTELSYSSDAPASTDSQQALASSSMLPSPSAAPATVDVSTNSSFLLMTLVFVWLCVVCLLIFKYVWEFIIFQLAIRDAEPARQDFAKQWMELQKACRVKFPIPLFEHAIFGPMLSVTPAGMRVIVPRDFWEELSSQQRLGILRHELAHYQRRDILWSLIARILTVLQWFNPFAWYALRRFEHCVELSCDQSLLHDTSVRPTEYAHALIQLIEYPQVSPLASRPVRGASISERIRNLLSPQVLRDSAWRRLALSVFLLALLSTSFFHVQLSPQLSAQELPNAPAVPSENPSDRESAIAAFLSKLIARSDEDRDLIKRFVEGANTPAGQIVIADSISEYENQLRQQAESESTVAFASEMFEKVGEKYVLKPEYTEFPTRFENARRQFDEDLAKVDKLLKDTAARLSADSETNQLIKRFFLDSDAAAQVYTEHVRNFVHPDYRFVREQWNEFFVLDQSNRLVVRSGAKRSVEQHAKTLTRAMNLGDRLHRATNQWRQDLSESNPISSAMRTALGEKTHATLFAINTVSEDYSNDQKIENYFDYLENQFIDKADGLIPNDESLPELQENLKTYAATKAMTLKLQPHLITMAKQLGDEVPEVATWRNLLASDAAVLWTVDHIGNPAADVESAFNNWISEWLVENDEGKLTVQPEQEGGLLDTIRDQLRTLRAMRRKGLDIAEFGKRIDHPQLSQAYQTIAGRCLVTRSLQDRLSRQYFDGFSAWVNDHFELNGNDYQLKEGQADVLIGLLEAIENIKQELANDDF